MLLLNIRETAYIHKTLSFLIFRDSQTCLFSIVQYPADFWIPSSIYQPQPKKSRRTKSFFLSLKMKHAKKTLTVSSIILFLCIYLLFFYLFSIFSNLLQLSTCYLFREVGSIHIIWSHRCFIFMAWNQQCTDRIFQNLNTKAS